MKIKTITCQRAINHGVNLQAYVLINNLEGLENDVLNLKNIEVFLMNADLISIIVPVYNVEKYLIRCVNSIIHQTYENIEIILVDDGSTDESGYLCDKLLNEDSRIKTFHKENGGLSDARNYGIARAMGDFLFFVDSDDWVEPEVIEVLIDAIKEEDADIAICGLNDIVIGEIKNKRGSSNKKVLSNTEAIDTFFNNGDDIGVVVWNKLYKKELFENIIFEVGKLHEDVFFTPKVLFYANKIIVTNYYGYNYINDREDSICNKKLSVRSIDGADANYNNYIFFKEKGMYKYSLLFYIRFISGLIAIACQAHKERNDEIENLVLNRILECRKFTISFYIKQKCLIPLFKFIIFIYFRNTYYFLWCLRWN